MEKKPVKILIFGLDNSGKTSISLCLRRKNNLSYFTSLAPTRAHDILEFTDKTTSTKIVIWDFGGQEQQRNEYIQDLTSNFTVGAKKLIYVIDIQDEERYDLAIDYFQNILRELNKDSMQITLSIFLHKFDPNIEFQEDKISDLINKIRNLIPNNFKYDIFKTSINTVFRKTIAS
jgi:GTPase SAR1 family protein